MCDSQTLDLGKGFSSVLKTIKSGNSHSSGIPMARKLLYDCMMVEMERLRLSPNLIYRMHTLLHTYSSLSLSLFHIWLYTRTATHCYTLVATQLLTTHSAQRFHRACQTHSGTRAQGLLCIWVCSPSTFAVSPIPECSLDLSSHDLHHEVPLSHRPPTQNILNLRSRANKWGKPMGPS